MKTSIATVAVAAALMAAQPAAAQFLSPSASAGAAASANSNAAAGAAASVRSRNVNTNVNSLRSTNVLRQSQGQIQGQSQSTRVGGQANSQSNVQGTSYNYPRQAPTVFVPNAPVGASSCMTAITFGGSVAAGGIGFSLPWADHRCDTRLNTVLIASVVGRRAAAQNLCWDDEMAASVSAAGLRCRVGHYAR